MPIHTSPMNKASGSTMPADHASAPMTRRPLPNANISVIARITPRLAGSRATSAPAMITKPKMTAPFGVIHAAEDCAGRIMAMNSRGVAR
jgi:hypothetical protein